MSLKAFHILFVTVSVTLAAGFGVWCVKEYQTRREVEMLWMGAASFVGAGVLVVYGRWFLRKLRGVDCL